MEHCKTAEDFCRFLWRQYLVERRYDILGEVVAPELSVIGTGAHEISRNLEEFTSSMAREGEEWDGSFLIKDQWYQTTELSNQLFLVIGEILAKEDSSDGILYDVRFRFSILVRRTPDSWRIIHVHQSAPDPNQAKDEFFPHRMVEQDGRQMIYNLRHDSMTGLLNRLYLRETISRYMAGQPQGVMLMLDIDDFKRINDSYGHPVGDKALILLAESLKSSFPSAAIGRIGGDEFVVYLSGQAEDAAFRNALEEFKTDWLQSQRALPFEEKVTVSVGVSQCPRDGDTYDGVWRMADQALYTAKKSGKNQIYPRP